MFSMAFFMRAATRFSRAFANSRQAASAGALPRHAGHCPDLFNPGTSMARVFDLTENWWQIATSFLVVAPRSIAAGGLRCFTAKCWSAGEAKLWDVGTGKVKFNLQDQALGHPCREVAGTTRYVSPKNRPPMRTSRFPRRHLLLVRSPPVPGAITRKPGRWFQ